MGHDGALAVCVAFRVKIIINFYPKLAHNPFIPRLMSKQ